MASVPAGAAPGLGHVVEMGLHEYPDIHVEGDPWAQVDMEVFSDCLDMAGIVESCLDDRNGPSASAEEHIESLEVRWGLSRCRSSHRRDEVQQSRRKDRLSSWNPWAGCSSRSVPASSSSASCSTGPRCHRSAISSSISRGPQVVLHYEKRTTIRQRHFTIRGVVWNQTFPRMTGTPCPTGWPAVARARLAQVRRL